jgi:hypothetical protein
MASAPRPVLVAPASQEVALEELMQLFTGYQFGAELPAYCRDPLEVVEGHINVPYQDARKTWTLQ